MPNITYSKIYLHYDMFQAMLYERGEHIDSTDSGISCLGDLTHHQSPLTQAESVEYAVCH